MEPTIYKPSIYKGAGIYKAGAEGGGGGENPDGSTKKFVLLNKSSSEFLEIPGTFQTKYNYEFSCLGYDGGLFGILNSSITTYYYKTYLGFRNTGSTAQGRQGYSGNWGASGYSTGALNTFKITDNGTLKFSVDSNGIQVFSDSRSGYGNGIADKLYIFRCYDTQVCGVGSFLELKILDENNENILFDFLPAEKEGVAGVYDAINNVFYGDPYQDGKIVAI